MRTLLAIVILAALGWSGWWWFNASARERALAEWLAARRADGWQAEAAEIRVTGFPNRVDVLIDDLRLADPEAGWSWHASGFQILSLTWKPHQFIVALPGQQLVATPYETLTATSDLLRGSVAFRPNTRLELDHSTFEIEGMAIASDQGWTAEIGKAILATRQAAGIPFAHDVAFDAETLRLPEGLAGPADGVLSDTIGPVALDTTLAFDRPWERSSVEGDSPVLEGVEIRRLALAWGELDLAGSGDLAADAEGYAQGRIDLRARNWRTLLDVAESSGALNPTVASAVRAGLGLIAGLGGDAETLSVPLDFGDGRTRLGPVPLGPAPRLAPGRAPAGG
jgi:hypothetical protein